MQESNELSPLVDDTGLIVPPPPSLWQSAKDYLFRLRASQEEKSGRLSAIARQLAADINWHEWQPGRPTVLCFSRATFNKDVDEMRRRTNLNLAGLSTVAVKQAQERWIAPEWQVQTYFTGLLDRQLNSFRPYLVAFGRELLLAAKEYHPVDALMAANSDYWQDEALRLAGRELGIPFITLCRENYTIPVDQKTVLTRYGAGQFRYSGAAIAVYSSPTKDVLVKSGSFTPDMVEVTGAPRFDRWRDIAPRPMNERAYLTIISFASPLYYAPQTYHEAVEAIGAAYKGVTSSVQAVVKVKKENEVAENKRVAPLLAEQGAKFIADWSLFDLLPNSRAVIGYNSMAVAEGLLTEVPVIIPSWGDAVRHELSMFTADSDLDRRCIYFPTSPAELGALTRKAVTEGLPVLGTRSERLQCFSKVIEAPVNTTSSALVEDLVRRHVKG
jgi:hypothetical protein